MFTNILIVTGPLVEPTRWWPTSRRHEYTSLPFYNWIWNGMAVAVMKLWGPPCRDNVDVQDRPVDKENTHKRINGTLEVVVSAHWPLHGMVKTYLETRKSAPYFPEANLKIVDYPLGIPSGPKGSTGWLYLDPIGHPHEGTPQDIGLKILGDTSFTYWHQGPYQDCPR